MRRIRTPTYLRGGVDEVCAAPPEAGDGHGVRGERHQAAARQRVPDPHVAVLRRAAQLPTHAFKIVKTSRPIISKLIELYNYCMNTIFGQM